MKLYTVLTTEFALGDLEMGRYFMDGNIVRVIAVLDQRRNPMTIYTQLAGR